MCDKKFNYILKVLQSCKTPEQISTCTLWACDLGLSITQLFKLEKRDIQQREYIERIVND